MSFEASSPSLSSRNESFGESTINNTDASGSSTEMSANDSSGEDSNSENSGFECFFSDSDDNGLSHDLEPPKKRGRPLKHVIYPNLVKYAEEYLDICSVGAHDRRRNSNEYWSGSTGNDMTTYINRRIHDSMGGCRTDKCPMYVSRHTVRRLGLPAHAGFKASKHYKKFINAKRCHKQYDAITKEQHDFHYTASQVNHLLDLAAIFKDDVVLLSVDNKSKVSLLAPAVSHHIRPRGLHLTKRAPNLPDHTYPSDEGKIVPSGYMELDRPVTRSQSARRRNTNLEKCLLPRRPGRARSLSPPRKYPFDTYIDESGRERLRVLRYGRLHLYVFAEYFYKSTSTRHVNHLNDLLANLISVSGKSVVYLITDGGSDWNGTFTINLFNFGRLWRALKVDSLVIARYAPSYSKYNMIERRWASLTKRLAAVTFADRLPGEKEPPWKQHIPKEEQQEKCAQVFDKAVNDCCAYFQPDVYKGYGVSITPVLSTNMNQDIIKDSDHRRHADLFKNANVPWRNTHPEVVREITYFVKHCHRGRYKLEFSRCANQLCECNETPVKAHSYMKLLKALGGFIPTPERDLRLPDHYRNLLSMLLSPSTRELDDALLQTSIFRCEHCQFLCFSRTDHTRHTKIMHV